MELSNPWFVGLLCSVVAIYLLQSLAGWLNLSHFSDEVPDEFRDTYDAAAYAKSQAYHRENQRFSLLQATFSLLIFLAFWLSGGFGWLDGLVRSWTASPIWQGLLGCSILCTANAVIGLPFSWWDTFHIEAKYGFNKMTSATFVADTIKNIGLSAVLGLPLLALLIWLFESFPNAWVWAWLATTAFMLLLQYIAPRYLMPLFNKFTPLGDGSLKTAIVQLAERCAFPIKDLFVIDGSLRSTKANAFFAGFGKNKRIALYDTLIEKHPEPELLAVLAHEIGHFKCRHVIQRMIVGIGQMALIFLLFGLLLKHRGIFTAFGAPQTSVWLSLIFFSVLLEPIQLLLGIISSRGSRKHEYEADAYAATAMTSPAPLISGLKRLSVDTLSNLTPHPFYVFLHYSHPPILQRLAALRAWKP
jgi:STE24 endopeptidase